jgi:hypothetical protein
MAFGVVLPPSERTTMVPPSLSTTVVVPEEEALPLEGLPEDVGDVLVVVVVSPLDEPPLVAPFERDEPACPVRSASLASAPHAAARHIEIMNATSRMRIVTSPSASGGPARKSVRRAECEDRERKVLSSRDVVFDPCHKPRETDPSRTRVDPGSMWACERAARARA